MRKKIPGARQPAMETAKEIPLREIDRLRFERLLLQQQLLQQQLVYLENQRNLLWHGVERRYRVKGYRLDLTTGVLIAPDAPKEPS